MLALLSLACLATTVSAFGGGLGPSSSSFALVHKEHKYKTPDGTELTGDLWYEDRPQTDPGFVRPALIIAPFFLGLGEHEAHWAEEWAKKGFAVFALGYFVERKDQTNSADIGAALNHAMGVDRQKFSTWTLAGYKAFTDMPMVNKEQVAIAGFCFGAMAAYDLARRPDVKLAVVAGFHGNTSPMEGETGKLKSDAHYASFQGRVDPFVSLDTVTATIQELDALTPAPKYTVTTYGGLAHSFTHAATPAIAAFFESIGFGGAMTYDEVAHHSSFTAFESIVFTKFGL